MADNKAPEAPKQENQEDKDRLKQVHGNAGGNDDKSDRAEDRTGPTLLKTDIGGKDYDLTESEQTQLRTSPSIATVEDPAGIERIVVPDLNQSGWTPGRVEPDPVEVERLERVQKGLEAKKAERLDALKS
jgi:hypothetical protein